MIQLSAIENISYKEIINDIDKYIKLFLDYGFLVIKQLGATPLEQEEITKIFGLKLNWTKISSLDEENHSYTINNLNKKNYNNNQILVPWHLEDAHSSTRQIASTWSMIKLDCSKDSGTTGLVYSSNILSKMPKKWIKFLDKSKIINTKNDSHDLVGDAMQESKIYVRDCLIPHRNTGIKILNISPMSYQDILYSVDGLSPSSSDIDNFILIKNWIENSVKSYENIPEYWLKWSLGDLVIVDLTTVYHAVKGGFLPGERIFRRHWAWP